MLDSVLNLARVRSPTLGAGAVGLLRAKPAEINDRKQDDCRHDQNDAGGVFFLGARVWTDSNHVFHREDRLALCAAQNFSSAHDGYGNAGNPEDRKTRTHERPNRQTNRRNNDQNNAARTEHAPANDNLFCVARKTGDATQIALFPNADFATSRAVQMPSEFRQPLVDAEDGLAAFFALLEHGA